MEESAEIPKILGDLAAGLHDAVLMPPAGGGGKQQQQQPGGSIGGMPVEEVAAALRDATPAAAKLQVGAAGREAVGGGCHGQGAVLRLRV